MPNRMAIVLAALILSAPGIAHAGNIDESTKCSVLNKQFSDDDYDAIRESAIFMMNVMDNLDMNHTENGEPGIMSEMSDKGRLNVAAVASDYCSQHPKSTIYNAAASTYRGIRAMEMSLGVAK